MGRLVLLLPCVWATVLLLAVGSLAAAVGATRHGLMRVNAEADLPAELRPLFDAQAQLYRIEWPYFAAYVRHQLRGWQLPIPTRLQRLQANRDYNYQFRQDPCHPESFNPAPPPPPDLPDAPVPPDPCQEYRQPADRPTERTRIEADWQADARGWLDQQFLALFAVATAEAMLALPPPLDAGARIQSRIAPADWRTLRERARLYAEFYAALTEEPGLREMADREDATIYLTALDWEYAFPVAGGADFRDDWGEDRPQNRGYGITRHQGTDLFAPAGTPLVAVTNGTVIDDGWSYLGGWTVTIKGEDGLGYYYAHLQAPSPLQAGQRIALGEQVGLLGDTGQGPPGTSGKMPPHLHFGIYTDDQQHVTNPHPYLRFWEEHPPAPLRCASKMC